MTNVLVSLYKGYGLGDAVSMSAVLRHVAKHRPDWVVDFQAEEGRHCVGRGIVASTFAYGQPYPSPHYDAEVQIVLYDTPSAWSDRPNTLVARCLDRTFGLFWDRECARYRVEVGVKAQVSALALLARVLPGPGDFRRAVGVHYQGDSAQTRKNLDHDQALSICQTVERRGRVPVLLDWRDRSPLPDDCRTPTVGRSAGSRAWGGNPEMNCAVISQCQAFVGIDSGPAKCAAATDTPSLVVWTGHHPAHFFDPAPNVTHLVPRGYQGLEPVFSDQGVLDFFEANYTVRWYDGDPVREIETWLAEVLR